MALTTNIVSYYKMEGNSNDSVTTNNGTDTSISYNSSFGKILQGASLNGTTSFIGLPSGIYSLFNGTSNWTINAWFNIQTQPTGGTEGTIYNSTSNTAQNFQRWNAHFHAFDSDGSGTATKLKFYRANGASVIGTITGNTTLSTGTYYMGTVTYDGSNINLYLNGSLDATAVSSTGSASTGANGRFGKAINSSSSINYWNGYLDEIGFWSRALSGSEITQLYNSGSGLTYPFINSTGNFFFAASR